MRNFQVEIPHTLSLEQARARLERAREKLESEYGAECRWEGEQVMRVSRKGLDATVTVNDDRLSVAVKLGLLLTPLGGTIQDGIAKRLASLMAAPE